MEKGTSIESRRLKGEGRKMKKAVKRGIMKVERREAKVVGLGRCVSWRMVREGMRRIRQTGGGGGEERH